jgi:hypothetical protein
VQQLAVRLIHGEVIDYLDARQRHWRGTDASLLLALSEAAGHGPVIVDSDAYTVAVALAEIEVADLEA